MRQQIVHHDLTLSHGHAFPLRSVFPGIAVRQVNEDELVYIIQRAMQAWPAFVLRDMKDHRHDVRMRGRVAGARTIAQVMARLEILSDTPTPPAPFSYADLTGVSGVAPSDDQ